MTTHIYTQRKYIGKNMIGRDCTIYELWDGSTMRFQLTCPLRADGSEEPKGAEEFEKRIEQYMDLDASDGASN